MAYLTWQARTTQPKSTTRDPLLRGFRRRLGKARIDPARFRGSGVGHLHPLALATDDAKLFAFLRNPKRVGGRRWCFSYINVDRDPNPLVRAGVSGTSVQERD